MLRIFVVGTTVVIADPAKLYDTHIKCFDSIAAAKLAGHMQSDVKAAQQVRRTHNVLNTYPKDFAGRVY